MKKMVLPALVSLVLGATFCKNDAPKTVDSPPVSQPPASVLPADLNQPMPSKPAASGQQPNTQPVQNQPVKGQNQLLSKSAEPTKTATNLPANSQGEQPKPRPEMPADTDCFASLNTDGRLFEIRLGMIDEKRVTGDLLVRNIKTGEFVQGKLTGELREKIKYLLTWAYVGDDHKRHIINLSYYRDGERLIERSQDAEADGRVFKRARCTDFK